MSKPVIVITVGRQNHYTPRREPQMVTTGCNVEYVSAVLRSGGAPVLLSCLADEDAIRAVLEYANGVMLTGGGDVISLTYGEEPHPKSLYQDPVRDEMELEVTRLALEMGLPVLGVCRGIQLINVALGGTLVQDIPCQIPDAVKHYAQSMAPTLLHTIDIEADSILAGVLKTTSLAVNSYHHQAVRDLGRGLQINCRARDGVIEGIESSDGKPILAVQCHPEEICGIHPEFQAIFDWLVAEAGKA